MASYNKVVLLGNITRDLELRHIPSGTAVLDLGLAVNDRVKRGEEWVDEPTFVDVVIFGKTAEVASQYLRKGSPVLIDGRLKLDQWTNDAGEKRSKIKVICEKMQMVGSKSDGGGSQQSQPSQQPERQYTGPQGDESIPF